MVYLLTHKPIIAIYLLAPLIAMVVDIRARMRRRRAPLASSLLATVAAAVMIGTALTMVYGILLHGRTSIGQLLLAMYLAFAFLVILKAIDWSLQISLTRIFRTRGKHGLAREALDLLAFAARVCVLIAIGLPFMLAGMLTYR